MSARDTILDLRERMGRNIIGQEHVVERLLLALLCNGNVLIEGLPGLAKTRAVKGLAKNLDAAFSRIQFTPDLLPADITGAEMYLGDDAKERFIFQPGPIFANIVLADEVNRAPAKVQAALLEAMEERQITVANTTHKLPPLFMVMATQNPVEQEGTYPLPEAQLDRFFYKVIVPYPTKKELAEVVLRTTGTASQSVNRAASAEDILRLRQIVREVPVNSAVLDFALSIIVGTHPDGDGPTNAAKKYCRYGASPRGAQAMITAGKIYALLDGRYNVSQDDILRSAVPALQHRIILNFEAEADGLTPAQVVNMVVEEVKAGKKDPINV